MTNMFLFWFAVIGAFLLCFHIRLHQVVEYRKKLLVIICVLAQRDTLEGKDCKWRLNAFEKVSFDDMLWKFWKPLDSFYEHKNFLM